jgi:lipoprotein-anchoring transpeptidase ErfK/SrfK
MRRRMIAVIGAVGAAASLVLSAAPAVAEPVPAPVPAPPAPPAPPANPFGFPPPPPNLLAPGAPAADPLAVPGQTTTTTGTAAGQNPLPFTGEPPFRPPTFNPVNGSMVGVAKPIIINFAVPIANRQMAEDAIHISSNPPVPGRFYWMSDSQVRWRPQDFWPKGTVVNIDAAGTKSSFRVGESLVATVDNDTKQMEIMRDGVLEKTMPVSMGKSGYETKNGTYYVLEKFADIVMDSSTYGVPVTDDEGYKIDVEDAVRIDNSGIFVHGAPWSEADQGVRNVSHGCINLSAEDAQWFFDNFGSGDPVVIKNSTGLYDQNDGAQDRQLF